MSLGHLKEPKTRDEPLGGSLTLLYWAIVAINVFLLICLVTSASALSYIPKFVAVTLLWSAMWAVIVHLGNLFFEFSPPWRHSNFVIVSLWHVIEALWFSSSELWDVSEFLREFWLWPWWSAPSSNADLAHLTAILFVTLSWSVESQSNKEAIATEAALPAPGNAAGDRNEVNRSALRGPVDFRMLVDPESVRSLAVSIASNYPHTNQGTLMRAAALFEYVKENVTYVPDPIRMQSGEKIQGDLVASPIETLQSRGGDCDDQAVLMASLFSAVGIPNRLRLICNDAGEWHLAAEFSVELPTSNEIVTILDEFYDAISRTTQPRTYWFFQEEGQFWLLADTTRDYIPGYDSLFIDGYMYKSEEGELQWVNCHSIH